MEMKNKMIYKYCGTTKELLAITTIDDLIDNEYTAKQISNIKNYALKGSKGYGYIDGYYWSLNEVKIMSNEEEAKFFIDYMGKIYNKFHDHNKKFWYYSYDNYMNALMLTLDAIKEGKEINIYEPYIRLKMSGTVKNEIARFNNDSCKVAKEYTYDLNNLSDIDSYDSKFGKYIIYEDDITFEYSDDNNKLLIDILFHYLTPYFDEEIINAWVEYKVRTKVAYIDIYTKYGYNRKAFKSLMDGIDKHIEEVLPMLMSNYNTLKINDFEELTLKDLIKNV